MEWVRGKVAQDIDIRDQGSDQETKQRLAVTSRQAFVVEILQAQKVRFQDDTLKLARSVSGGCRGSARHITTVHQA
jgi:hypothetical protein